jgi:hypothetical protein
MSEERTTGDLGLIDIATDQLIDSLEAQVADLLTALSAKEAEHGAALERALDAEGLLLEMERTGRVLGYFVSAKEGEANLLRVVNATTGEIELYAKCPTEVKLTHGGAEPKR